MNGNTVEAKMPEEDALVAEGKVDLVIRVQNMFLDREIRIDLGKNIVTNSGLRMTLSRLRDTTYNPLSHLAVGTGGTAENAGNTALAQEKTRKAATITIDTSRFKLIATASFSANEINGCQEAGLFNASTGGTLFARKVFDSAISVPEGFTAELRYEISLARA